MCAHKTSEAIMNKNNKYSNFIKTRVTTNKKEAFRVHAEKKGFAMSTLLKKLMDKDMKENIIPPNF
jgi:hypothetical protein